MATRVFAIAELVFLIVELVNHDTPTLASLCLVNRDLNTAVTPFLYRVLRLEKRNELCLLSNEKLSQLLHSPLDLAISITYSGLYDMNHLQVDKIHQRRSAGLLQVLKKTRNITSFKLINSNISSGCLESLAKIPTLQDLHLAFSDGCKEGTTAQSVWRGFLRDQCVYDRTRFDNPTAFMPFTNLTCLAMLNLRGNILPWAECIANILIASPSIESLNISLSNNAFQGRSYPTNCNRIPYSFMTDICTRYAKELEPLKLKKLHLDDYINPAQRRDLEILTDLTVLEEISIYNDCGVGRAGYDIDFSILSPEISPSLKAISFYELPDEIWRGFAGLCVGMRRIELRFSHHIGNEYDTFPDSSEYSRSDLDNHRFPPPDSPTPSLNGNTLGDLDSLEKLTPLGINIKHYNPDRLNKVDYLADICDIVSSLPRLEALWMGGSKAKEMLIAPNLWRHRAAELSYAGPLLTYIRIHGESWHLCREPEFNLVPLDKWDDKEVRPDFFDTEYPSAWATAQD